MENDELRLNMGKKGRQFVRENYEVNLNFNDIEKIYDSIFDKYKNKMKNTAKDRCCWLCLGA